MGTNGSFDVATLTDHLFINYIYEQVYTDKSFIGNCTYGKVGDDLWIYDPEDLIPKYYEKINLPINWSKSKSYCKLGSVAEFCSRTFLDGEDVSRISPKIISKSSDFRYLPLLLRLCSSRNVQLNRSSFTYLDNNVRDSEETYFEKLQPWIISAFAVQRVTNSLDLNYMVRGGWLTDRTKALLEDQTLMLKIQTAWCLCQMVRFYQDIEAKTTETVEAEGVLSMDEVFLMADGQRDYFDPQNPCGAFALKWFESDNKVLSPKQVFVLGRYITQNRLVTDRFYEIYSLDPAGDTYVSNVRDILEEVSERSAYDRGNLNYDTAGYVSTQYEIVKTLSRLDSTFCTLSLSRSEIDVIDRLIGEPLLQSRIARDLIGIHQVDQDNVLTEL
jgi:hypothetical protein